MRACAGNVLLCGVTDNRHKFCAKVADFGLARDLGVVSRVETRTYGTLTHMAPEVLSSDIVSKVRACAKDCRDLSIVLPHSTSFHCVE